MSDSERFIFGFTYSGYSRASDSIHYSPNRHDYSLHADQNRSWAIIVGLTCLAVVARVHGLIGASDNPIVNQITRALEATQPRDQVYRLTHGDIAIGDFVLVYDHLAEVIDITKTAYGYRSYRVCHLGDGPMSHIKEDAYPPWVVRLLYRPAEFMTLMERMAKEGIIPHEQFEIMSKLPAEKVQASIRAAITRIWATDDPALAPLKRRVRE